MNRTLQRVIDRRGKVYHGWWIVSASAVINAFGGGIFFQGFTVFFLPITRSLGLSRLMTTLPFALSRVEGGIMGPLSGMLIDRYGVKRLMMVGSPMVGLGYILLSFTTSFTTFLLVYLLIISVGATTTFMQATMASVNTWFIRKRGLTISIISGGNRLGTALMVPALALSVHRYGWEDTARFAGISVLLVVVPLTLVFHRSPESRGLRPDGDPPRPVTSGDSATGESPSMPEDNDYGVREALRTRAYWFLAAATAVRIAAFGAIFVHFIPILVWKGLGEQEAANLLGLISLLAIGAGIFFGWLGDRISKQRMVSAGMLGAAFCIYLLNAADSRAQVYTAMLIFTLVESVIPLNWVLVGDFFGRRNFATLRGIITSFNAVSMLVSSLLAGLVYDLTDSYEAILVPFVFIFIISGVLFWVMPPPRRKERPLSVTEV